MYLAIKNIQFNAHFDFYQCLHDAILMQQSAVHWRDCVLFMMNDSCLRAQTKALFIFVCIKQDSNRPFKITTRLQGRNNWINSCQDDYIDRLPWQRWWGLTFQLNNILLNLSSNRVGCESFDNCLSIAEKQKLHAPCKCQAHLTFVQCFAKPWVVY